MEKLVIIGGGFAGTTIAKALEMKFDTTLIDSKDYFEYTPAILRTIVEPGHLNKVQRKHETYLKKAKVIVGHVSEVDEKFVLVDKEKIHYDYLVVCSGSDYNNPIKEQDVVIGSRSQHLKHSHEKLKNSNKILIIGGGLVGVELAAEICEHYHDKKISLVHSRDHLMPRNNPKTVAYVENFLLKRGVELVLNERIKEAKKGVFVTEKGKVLPYDMAFMTVGTKPNYDFMEKNFSKCLSDRHQIKVDENLRVVGCKNIFAAGDIIDLQEEKTAQNAEHHAHTIVHNILALESSREPKKYKSRKRMLVISLGKYNGVIEKEGFVLGGKIPALFKLVIEKWVMFGYG
jgi:apoptosis-inducing factor 2